MNRYLKSDRLRLEPGGADTWPGATTCRVLGALALIFALILALGWVAEMALWVFFDQAPTRNMVSAAGEPCAAYLLAHCLFSLGRYKRFVEHQRSHGVYYRPGLSGYLDRLNDHPDRPRNRGTDA